MGDHHVEEQGRRALTPARPGLAPGDGRERSRALRDGRSRPGSSRVGIRGGDDQRGAARVVAAQGGQDLGRGVQAGHRDRVGRGAQGGGDGHLEALGHRQPLGERTEHPAEAARVGEQGRGGIGAPARGFGQRFGPCLPGGQFAG